jgi:hypothetical protein
MEEQKPDQENLIEKIKIYIRLKSRLAVLSTVEKVAEFYAAAVSNILLTLCFLMMLIFASLGTAFWLNEVLNSTWLGFFWMAGVYLLFFIIVIFIKSKWIEEPLMDRLVRKMLAEKIEEKDGE